MKREVHRTNEVTSLEIFALFMLTGIFSTLLIPETKGRSLEELSNEDQQDFIRYVCERCTRRVVLT